MKEIYAHADGFKVHIIKQALENHDIPAFIYESYSGAIYNGVGGIAQRLLVPDDYVSEAIDVIKALEEL